MSGVDKPIMDKAAELFGWAYGLGGFDVAVQEFVKFVRAQSDARIAELDGALLAEQMQAENLSHELAAIKAQEPVMWRYKERADDQRSAWLYVKKRMHIPGGHKFEALYAAPVSEAKAQGVALDGSQLAGLLEQVRLDDGEAKPHGNGAPYWNNAVIACQAAIRDALAAPVQQPKCKTCDDNGRIGGPSFYAPDEGGEPCPDCCAPVQQVSVPECYARLLKHAFGMTFGEDWNRGTAAETHRNKLIEAVFDCRHLLAAAPAAPAADAGLVAVEWAKDAEEWGPALNEAGWLFLSELNEDPQKSALIFNSTKGPLRAAIMKYAEIVTAHCAKGVV